jgi:2',3'-cyclic-nucleotide 2'-phosphodiesterase (5'-nucleotidase family)
MKKMIQLAGTCLVLLMSVVPGLAEQRLTILHTNDLHSHLLGADGRNSGL